MVIVVLITEKPHQRRWQPSAPSTSRTSSGGRSRAHVGALAPLSPRAPVAAAAVSSSSSHLVQQPHTGDHVAMGVPSIHHAPHPPVFHNYQNGTTHDIYRVSIHRVIINCD